MLFITCLSVMGSLSIIFCYIAFPRLRNANSRIVVSLSIADLGTSTCGAICGEYLFHRSIEDYAPHSTLCVLQASFGTFFSISSVCWLATIAISNYLIVIRKCNPSFKVELVFHIVCWGLPLIPTIYAVATGKFGHYAMLWCGFNEDNVIWQILSLTVFVVPVSIIIVYCYYSIIKYVTHTQKEVSTRFKQIRIDTRAIYRMSGYIANYLLGWFPYFISYIFSYSNPDARFFTLQVIISGLAHSQGITNFLLYCLNRSFILMVKSKISGSRTLSVNISNHRLSSPYSEESINSSMELTEKLSA